MAILQEFYEFGTEIGPRLLSIVFRSLTFPTEKIYPKLIKSLFGGNNPNENLKGQQALAKQLADVIDFALRFDDAKARSSPLLLFIFCFSYSFLVDSLFALFTAGVHCELDGKSGHSERLQLLQTLARQDEDD